MIENYKCVEQTRLKRYIIFWFALLIPVLSWAQAPTVTDFSPDSGAEGATVVITGTNFSTVDILNEVKFNGTTAVATESTPTSITTTVPAGATSGTISVTVGVETGTSASSFTVLLTPTISEFTPSSGAETVSVTINGTDFGAITNLAFNGTAAIVTSSDASSITTTVPAGATTGKISFTTSGIDLISATDFDVLATPTISSFNPGSGAVGADVTITGTNLTAITNLVLGGQTAPVNFSDATTITTTVPAGATTGKITFTTSGINLVSSTDFDVLPTPTITNFTPGSGAVGADVTITGTNLTAISNLVLGGQTAPVNSSNGTTIETTVPASATTGKISFTTSGINLVSSTDFDVLPTPTITNFSPGSGAVGATVTITGTNLTAISNLVLGGQPATVNSSNSTTIETTVPASASTGKISFTTSGIDLISATNFDVLATPTITGFSPGSGAVGATVTITGTDLTTITNLVLGGQTAPVNFSDATTITTTVPAGATTGKITFTTSGIDFVSATNFTVLPSPTITDFNPVSGAVGATVTINGNNFNTVEANNLVSFNGTPANVTNSNPAGKKLTTSVPAGATTGTISVTTSGVTVTSASVFTVLPSPTLTGFNPGSGAVGTSVTITGTNFSTTPANNVVEFNGTTAIITASTATSITTSVPVGATTGLISVTTSGVTVSSASNFTVLPTPTITGFSPTSGAVSASVIISGTNFSTTPGDHVVKFNGTIGVVTASTTNSITTSVPAGATTGTISVTVSGVTVTSVSNFTVLPTPTITGFNPTSGAVSASVIINGTNFSTTPGDHVVKFNGTTAVVTASTTNSITTTVPAGATTGTISVTVSGVTVTSASNFTVLPSPTISGFNPTSGAVSASVIINGTNFSTTPGDHVVKFNGTTAVVTASTTNSITTTVPAGATTGTISVTVSGVTVTSVSNFTVLPTPTITGFSPTSGAVSASVIISGTNFSTTPGDHVVKFNGTTGVVTASTTNSITTSVPAGATTGTISVTVSGVTVTSSSSFTVLPTPTITSFNPTSGAVSAVVTISGTNFSATPTNNVVRFNGTLATVSASNANSITTSVPAGATSGTISVTTSGVTVTSVSGFTVLPSPTITGFSPTGGAVSATVTISGTNFSNTPANNVVDFNGTTAVVTASSSTSITTAVPAGATSGPISVTVSGVTVTSVGDFTVPGSPSITGFNPTSGAVTASVVITGTNFSSTPANNDVKFNGTTAVVTASTTNSITTSVPAGATTGKIDVTTSGVTVSSASNFTVLPTPTITGFNPASGAIGASVIITGTNFNTTPANNVVKFNGTTAVITASTANSITTSVPAGATSGTISVTVSGVTVTSSSAFTVLPSPTITGFNPTSGAVSAPVIISGSNFSTTPSDHVVKFNGTTATVTASTTNSITTTVPAGATTGAITVTVSGVTVTSASNFTVLPSPTVSGFNPTSGAVSASVVINGTNFSSTPADHVVKFNGTTSVVTASTSTSITTTVPNGATSGTISVDVSGISITSSSTFTVLPSPTISGFNPTSGAVSATVVLTGTNFNTTPANNVVKFNGTVAVITSATTTSLTTTVPSGATIGTISVTTSGVTITSASNFTVLPTPAITSFTPTSEIVNATVTITGVNFSTTPANNVVAFNGTPATVSASTATSITTKVPVGSTSGKISVTTSGVTVFSATNFTVIPSLTIISWDPVIGVPGTSVVITGTDFSTTPSENTLKFNGTTAVITASTSTTLTTTIPAGATTGPLSVELRGVTFTTESNFVVETTPPVLSTNFTVSEILKGSNLLISAQFSDPESEVVSASVIYRSVTADPETTTAPLVKVGNNWEFTISGTAIGELGIQYKLQATNAFDLEYLSSSFNYVRIITGGDGLVIPYIRYGADIGSYEIFSVPLDLDTKTVAAVFDELPPYAKSKWRISHYDNSTDTNIELNTSDPIVPGQGYWLIVRDNPGKQLKTGPGKSVEINPPFSIQLKAGWNQIGNPYNFDLLWSDLVAVNPGLPTSYRDYNGGFKNFENKALLSAMRGGFVNVSTDMNLIFPTKKNVGGRIKSDYKYLKNPIDATDWEVEFAIYQRDISNVIGGLGMRADAVDGFDPYDGFSMPRFETYLELNHTKSLNGYAYTKDITTTKTNHFWSFTVAGSSSQESTLITWDNSYFGVNPQNLFLVDESNKVWVNMKEHASYNFTAPAKFKVLYGDASYVNEHLESGAGKILSIAPNPSRGPMKVFIAVPGWQEKSNVQLDLISATGQSVTELFSGQLSPGYQEIDWTGTLSNGLRPVPGMYFVQLRCNGFVSTARVIIQ